MSDVTALGATALARAIAARDVRVVDVVDAYLAAGGLDRTETARFARILREQRALMSAGLARSHALYGKRFDVVRTLAASAAVHGYTTAFWWSAAIFAIGGVVCGLLLKPGVQQVDPAAEPVLAH